MMGFSTATDARSRRDARVFASVGFSAALCMLSACTSEKPLDQGPGTPQVQIAEASEILITPEVAAFGTLVHRNKAEVYPEAEGVLSGVFVDQGDQVSAGDLLAHLRQDRLLLRISRAGSALDQARAAYDLAAARHAAARRNAEAQLLKVKSSAEEVRRLQRAVARSERELETAEHLLAVDGATPSGVERLRDGLRDTETALTQAELQHRSMSIGFRDQDLTASGRTVPRNRAERLEALLALQTETHLAEVAVAGARVAEAETELRELELLRESSQLRAPIAGVIADRHIDLGERVTSHHPVFSIINTSELYLLVEVDERNQASVAPGQPARVLFDHAPETPVEGRVAFRAPYLNAQTRTGGVRISLDNSRQELSPGMFARVLIELGPPETRVIAPVDAVRNDAGDPHVYLLHRGAERNRVYRQPITVLDTANSPEGTLAVAGLAAGAELVLNPSAIAFADGTAVEVMP